MRKSDKIKSIIKANKLNENRHIKSNSLIKEDDYQDHLDTHYSADGMEDYHADKAASYMAEDIYDIGNQVYNLAKSIGGKYPHVNGVEEKLVEYAESLRQQAKKTFSDWGDDEFPGYGV